MAILTVNTVEISAGAIAAETQNHPAENAAAAQSDAARALVIRELLLQEAHRLGLDPAPIEDEDGRRETQEDALIRQLLEDGVPVPKADEASCRRYFEKNIQRFRSPDIFEAAHILLSASPEDEDAYAAATREAEVIIAAVTRRPNSFADFARQRSDCSSAGDDGRLGQVIKGQTTPEFETFLFGLEEGQLSPVPIKTRYGIHVLRLDRKIAGRTLPFEVVRDKIAAYLEETSWRQGVSEFMRILARDAEIGGIDRDSLIGDWFHRGREEV